MSNNITEYLKTAFEYKDKGDYKESIDYFYKALALDNESAEIMYELAVLYTNLCQYDRAYSFYEQIISKNPDDYKVKHQYALVLKDNKEYNKALNLLNELFNAKYQALTVTEELFDLLLIDKDFEKIIELYNENSSKIQTSKILYIVAKAYEAESKEDIAQEYYQKSFEADSSNVEAGTKICEIFLAQNNLEKAQELALKLLKISENDKLFYVLAEINYINKNFDSAIKYYSYAIKNNPQGALYYFKLGIVYSLKGYFSEAVQSYSRALILDPANQVYNYALAFLYYMNNNINLAEQIVDTILSFEENNKDALALKLILLTKQNKIPEAEKLNKKVSALEPKTDFMYYAQSVYYTKLNVWEKAIISIKSAIKINKNSFEYRYMLAKLYYNTEKIDEAQQVLNKITEENPKYIQAYILLAEIDLKNKQYQAAIDKTNTALYLDKNIAEVYYIKGSALYNKFDYDKAIENYKTALSINPKESEYYKQTGLCYYIQEKYQDAYYYFKEASNIDISNPEIRYYMAKCAQKSEDWENTSVNYSILLRLAPYNYNYAIEYAQFINDRGQKKKALSFLKSFINKHKNKEENTRIKNVIDDLKKKS